MPITRLNITSGISTPVRFGSEDAGFSHDGHPDTVYPGAGDAYSDPWSSLYSSGMPDMFGNPNPMGFDPGGYHGSSGMYGLPGDAASYSPEPPGTNDTGGYDTLDSTDASSWEHAIATEYCSPVDSIPSGEPSPDGRSSNVMPAGETWEGDAATPSPTPPDKDPPSDNDQTPHLHWPSRGGSGATQPADSPPRADHPTQSEDHVSPTTTSTKPLPGLEAPHHSTPEGAKAQPPLHTQPQGLPWGLPTPFLIPKAPEPSAPASSNPFKTVSPASSAEPVTPPNTASPNDVKSKPIVPPSQPTSSKPPQKPKAELPADPSWISRQCKKISRFVCKIWEGLKRFFGLKTHPKMAQA